jgi:hypothetical protein
MPNAKVFQNSSVQNYGQNVHFPLKHTATKEPTLTAVVVVAPGIAAL